MRLGWYAGVSTALAGAVVISAFQQRANFYSAMVYLAQSNFCLLAIVNFTLLLYSSFIYGLTKLCYGTLRAVEVEQLTERAWFAITETCLAMTIFREEIGAWFLVMFTGLVTGKVWGWIGDGRVEFLEQQPPTNPRLFHLRLSVSLAMSFIYDVWVLKYAVNTVIQQARPNMMVMFLFEFAVLATCSWRTGVRYILSIAEQSIVTAQTRQRLIERRLEVGQRREAMIREREQATANGQEPQNHEPLPSEDDIDEIDIEVPGWAAKGEWVLWLDLVTDMIKLGIYIAFFFMLLRFYGLPIHIMRDLFMTSRDFIKRLNALLRYRRAIQEMNKYPDATADELSQENTCIICREEMRPWNPVNQPETIDRVRPKKLPCGHVLHLGCLKSWLERQQVCPTCRRPVTMDNSRGEQNRAAGLPIQAGGAAPLPGGQQEAGDNNAPPGRQDPNGGQQPRARDGAPRVFNFGPIRLGFGANAHQARELAQQFGIPQRPAVPASTQNQQTPGDGTPQIGNLIHQTEQIVQRELQHLNMAQQELQIAYLLVAELQRLRQRRQQQQDQPTRSQPSIPPPAHSTSNITMSQNLNVQHLTQTYPQFPFGATTYAGVPSHLTSPPMARHGAPPNGPAIPAGSPDLPDGVTLPPGWSMIPLQRLDGTHTQSFSQLISQTPQAPPNGDASTLNQQAVSPGPGTSSANIESGSRAPTTGTQRPPNSPTLSQSGVGSGSGTLRPTPVVAPSPILPNWGGSAQLFSHHNRTDSTGNAARSASPSVNTEAASSDALDGRPERPVANESTDNEPHRQEANGADAKSSGVAPDKGKAKAATVEEAIDGDEG
ncbi:E3 ubiquitin-protein ligase hrd1 [Conoideocrella luteorostrata]|uniref:RING-type E3 ubiquitin transferase n=1 Tax=Conoideocrella luteorostrata TaxID=1105319 RepID=A0AAJ0CYP5_9HYPO|nr:E3 ubiquitin-protein ligase hrd1 [Conoideocrella luteorostrata]